MLCKSVLTRARRRCTILHAANRRIYGQWSSSIPSRFIAELPAVHVNIETTLTGGASLWRANWSEQDDPFAHVSSARPDRSQARGPGWQRALSTGYDAAPKRLAEPGRSEVLGLAPFTGGFPADPKAGLAVGQSFGILPPAEFPNSTPFDGAVQRLRLTLMPAVKE